MGSFQAGRPCSTRLKAGRIIHRLPVASCMKKEAVLSSLKSRMPSDLEPAASVDRGLAKMQSKIELESDTLNIFCVLLRGIVLEGEMHYSKDNYERKCSSTKQNGDSCIVWRDSTKGAR